MPMTLQRPPVRTSTTRAAVAASAVNPTFEDRYWQYQHDKQPYADDEYGYFAFAPAYRVGYMAVILHPNSSFDQLESLMHEEYDKTRVCDKLDWSYACLAAHAAWVRARTIG
ncbi:MAG: hypothetical protein JO218_04495 [Burkholderiales bacterium]|nr:hypothetical protein [Burkholderiales bacterium]